jgi:hypothetical protein
MWRICLLTGALVCLGAGEEQQAGKSQAADGKRNAPVTVSLTFDDTHADQSNAVMIMEKYHMLGTFYVNSPRIDKETYLTRANLDTMQARGHEIGGHTLNHLVCFDKQGIDVMRHEICDDYDNLVRLGYVVSSFAYPRGEDGGHAKVVAMKRYANARDVGGIAGDAMRTAESIPPGDCYLIRTPPSVKKCNTVNDLRGYVVAAQKDSGGWVPLVFHHISDAGDPLSITPAMFDEFLQWLSGERDAGRVVVKTVRDVIQGSAPR